MAPETIHSEGACAAVEGKAMQHTNHFCIPKYWFVRVLAAVHCVASWEGVRPGHCCARLLLPQGNAGARCAALQQSPLRVTAFSPPEPLAALTTHLDETLNSLRRPQILRLRPHPSRAHRRRGPGSGARQRRWRRRWRELGSNGKHPAPRRGRGRRR